MFVDTKKIPKFKNTDKVKLCLKFLNRWVDYCPSDGLSFDDKHSICSFVTFTFNGFYYTIIKPNLRPEYQENSSEGWKEELNRFNVYKFKLSDLAESTNRFNESHCIYKVAQLELDDEALFTILPTEPICDIRVDTEKQFQKEFKKVMKSLIK